MRRNFKSVLRDVMEANGVTVEALCEKVYGSTDNKEGLRAINEALTYQRYSRDLTKTLVTAAGGTEAEVTKAVAIAKAANCKEMKDLDALAMKRVEEAVAKEWDEIDETVYKPFFEDLYNRGDELVAEDVAKKAASAAKAAKKEKKEAQIDLGILDAEAPAEELNIEGVADPFDEN